MKDKIKEILYKYTSELTIKGICEQTDEWLWEGEFDKVADEIVKLVSQLKEQEK